MVGASSLCMVIAGVSIINPDIRAQISGALAGDTASQLAGVASHALDLVHTFARLSADYVPDSTPFVGFGILAVVLTAMMIRA